jgi:hypothetical protein
MHQKTTFGSTPDIILLQTTLKNLAPKAFPLFLLDSDFIPVTLQRVKEFQTKPLESTRSLKQLSSHLFKQSILLPEEIIS